MYGNIGIEAKFVEPGGNLARYCYFTRVSILATTNKHSRAMNGFDHDAPLTEFYCMIKRWPPSTLQRGWARLARDRPVRGHVSREAGISFTSPIANRRREVMSLPSCGKVRRVHQHAVSALHNTFSPIGMWARGRKRASRPEDTLCDF